MENSELAIAKSISRTNDNKNKVSGLKFILNKLEKPYNILIIGMILWVSFLSLYIIIFNSGFSKDSTDWRNFGNYLSGVSNFVNILVFIAISILISNINKSNRTNELKVERQKEIFSRFLDSYESFLKKLFELQINLAEIATSEKEPDTHKVVEYFSMFKSLDILLKSYFPQNELAIDLKMFLDQYNTLIGSIDAKKEKPVIRQNILALISEIKTLTNTLSNGIGQYLTYEIYNNGKENTEK
jgi:hypothetical protein